MTITWNTLNFPAGVEAEPVANIVRTLAGEQRGGLLTRRLPVIIETELTRSGVTWHVGATSTTTRRLAQATDTYLPGMTWTPQDHHPFDPDVAVEVRVRGLERLLAVANAEGSAARLLGVVCELRRGEAVLVQWQIGPWLARSPIPPASAKRQKQTIWNIATSGEPERDSEQVTAARQKTAEHVFACVGRIAVAGVDGQRDHHLIAAAGGAMQLLRAPGVGVSRRAIPSWIAQRRLSRYRVPSINPPCRLTATELAGLIGWPIGNPRLPGVSYVASRALPMDERCLRPLSDHPGQRVLGESAYPSQAGQVVVLEPKAATRHLHVVGPTGVGKSTMLTHLILADIAAGRSVIAIDPKGDMVTEIIRRLDPAERERVVVLDPSDEAPVGFNPLSGGVAGIDGVMHVIRSMWPDGPRLSDVIHAALSTLAYNPGHTLAELPILLTDDGFRRPLVARAVAADRLGLGTFWPWYESLSPDMRAQTLAPVMSRMRALLLRPALRAVLAQPHPRFDLNDIFTKRTSLLVRLPKGDLGAGGAELLGSLLVAQVWRLIQGRARIPAERRHPVNLVLDEFAEFLKIPMELPDVLVTARGLGVGLTMAHQHLGQLDGAVRAAVLANSGSRAVFRADFDDARVLAKRTGGLLAPEDLMGLEPFHAYASVMAGDAPTAYGSMRTRPLGPVTADPTAFLAANRQRFGTPRAETEERLAKLLTGSPSSSKSMPPGVLGGRRIDGGGT